MSTSCQSSNTEAIVKTGKGFLLIGAAKSLLKLPKNKTFKLVAQENDAVLTMVAANQIELRNNILRIRPVFWDHNSKLESKLVHRDTVVTLFEITQKSNSRKGYVLYVRSRECCT